MAANPGVRLPQSELREHGPGRRGSHQVPREALQLRPRHGRFC